MFTPKSLVEPIDYKAEPAVAGGLNAHIGSFNVIDADEPRDSRKLARNYQGRPFSPAHRVQPSPPQQGAYLNPCRQVACVAQ